MRAVVGSGRLIAGRYRLGEPIGRGAMGIVWHGRDELLARDVAVKEVQIPAQAMPADAELIYQRTLREARAAARLTHAGAVTVFDVVEENGSPWIVMELVDGRSLDRVIAEDGPLPPSQAAELGSSLIGALAAAHSAGVLHRDVKPSNVLVACDGRAVLTDFGIATFAGDPGQTQLGMVVGTPGFTAPERVRGEAATPASDLWSLGATLYAAVEGRGPFDRAGGGDAITIGVAREEAPSAPSAGQLGPVIDALLRRDPTGRPDAATTARLLAEAAAATVPSIAAVVAPPVFAELSMPRPLAGGDGAATGDLAASAAVDGSGDGGDGRSRRGGRAGRASRRRRLLLAAAGVAAMGAAAIVGWYLVRGDQATQALQNPAARGITVGGSSAPAKKGAGGSAAAGNQSSGGPGVTGSAPAVASNPSGDPSTGTSASPATSPTVSPSPGPTGPVLPPGYAWHRFTAAVMGTVAGFEIGMPSGWQQSVTALAAHLNLPASNVHLTVDLAPWTLAGPLAEADHLALLASRADPGYRLVALVPVAFRAVGGYKAAPAAELKYRWTKAPTGSVTELVILVTLATKSGPQPYTFTLTAPTATFGSASGVFFTAMPTFRPLPG